MMTSAPVCMLDPNKDRTFFITQRRIANRSDARKHEKPTDKIDRILGEPGNIRNPQPTSSSRGARKGRNPSREWTREIQISPIPNSSDVNLFNAVTTI